jgi:hypothetical protein
MHGSSPGAVAHAAVSGCDPGMHSPRTHTSPANESRRPPGGWGRRRPCGPEIIPIMVQTSSGCMPADGGVQLRGSKLTATRTVKPARAVLARHIRGFFQAVSLNKNRRLQKPENLRSGLPQRGLSLVLASPYA